MSDVIRWHKEYPDDWKRTWFECEKKWSSDIGCPDGVFVPFNIDAVINIGYLYPLRTRLGLQPSLRGWYLRNNPWL